MAINSTFYLNAANLASATAVYLDLSLTLIAPDGVYGDGTITREQSSGILLTAEDCVSCGTPCGGSIGGSGNQGIYLLNLDAGSTTSDVGAIIVRFDPFSFPDGIRATYNGNIYNRLSSPVNGIHSSSNPSGFTIVGSSGATSSCSSTWYPSGGSISLSEFLYSGSSFSPTGNTQTIAISSGDLSLNSASPGECIMVIPKVNASPSIVNFELLGPCGGTAFSISIECPVLLTGFSSSVVSSTSAGACALAETVTYYNASLASTPGTVGLYDFVFSDAYGASPLGAGFYKAAGSITGSNDWFQVDSNGIVIALGVCASGSCTLYQAECSIGTGTADFTNCATGMPDSVSLSVGETADFCAVTNTVTTTGGVTVSIIGLCS